MKEDEKHTAHTQLIALPFGSYCLMIIILTCRLHTGAHQPAYKWIGWFHCWLTILSIRKHIFCPERDGISRIKFTINFICLFWLKCVPLSYLIHHASYSGSYSTYTVHYLDNPQSRCAPLSLYCSHSLFSSLPGHDVSESYPDFVWM